MNPLHKRKRARLIYRARDGSFLEAAGLLPSSEDEAAPLRCRCARCAFTLVELLVVIAIIGILAALILSGVASAKARGLGTACLNNLKQLQMSYQMYADNNNEKLADNSVNFNEAGPNAWIKGNVQRYTASYSKDVTEGVLYGENQSAMTYRCPASHAFVHDFSGAVVPHNRSYSISVWLNCNAKAGVRKLNEIRRPGSVFVFIDENAISIDNGAFGVHPAPIANNYWNLPANRHSKGCNLSFADGHAEHWRWTGPYLNDHNSKFNADDTHSQRPDPDTNPTNLSYSNTRDPDLIRLSRAVPVAE
jgi:prepilin-type N-terminal cleavage/methylation domain-containing protein/prepilin-type processing-associated H-X9-DG protein